MKNHSKCKLVHYDGYVAGWLDSSIGDLLADLPVNCESMAYALITCLDSDIDPAALLRKNAKLRQALNGARMVKKGVLVSSKVLLKAGLRDQLFFGFDEVWFFPHEDIEPKPESVSIVGPRRIHQTNLDEVGQWMAENDCSLALGDGAGLNIVVKAHGLVKYLLGHTILQPQPTFRIQELWVQDEEKKPSTVKPGR